MTLNSLDQSDNDQYRVYLISMPRVSPAALDGYVLLVTHPYITLSEGILPYIDKVAHFTSEADLNVYLLESKISHPDTQITIIDPLFMKTIALGWDHLQEACK